MFKWKDTLFFSKGDKIGVLLLFILIFIGGSIYVYLGDFSKINVGYYQFAENSQNEFVEFEESLERKEIVIDTIESESISTISKKKEKTSSKLTSGQVIDINSVSATVLTRVPGIGKAYADRIVEYRTVLGGFFDLSQLTEIKGITNNKLIQILPYLTITKKHNVMNLNRISEGRLMSHPYLNENQLTEILTLRQAGKLTSIDDLLSNNTFLAKDIERLSPYITFD